MNKIDLGQTIAVLANVGVIAGIVFLGIELRQNNELMDAQLRFNRLSIATGSSTLIAENPELAEALAKLDGSYLDEVAGTSDSDALTPAEWNQLYAFRNRVIRNQEWVFKELTRAEISVEEYRRLARQPSWRAVWQLVRNELNVEFVAFMEEDVIGQ